MRTLPAMPLRRFEREDSSLALGEKRPTPRIVIPMPYSSWVVTHTSPRRTPSTLTLAWHRCPPTVARPSVVMRSSHSLTGLSDSRDSQASRRPSAVVATSTASSEDSARTQTMRAIVPMWPPLWRWWRATRVSPAPAIVPRQAMTPRALHPSPLDSTRRTRRMSVTIR